MSTTTSAQTDAARLGPVSADRVKRWEHWTWIAVLGALFVALFSVPIERTFRIATNASGDNWLVLLYNAAFESKWNADWSHALIVPLISLFYVFQHRDELSTVPRRAFWPGLIPFFAGIFGYVLGIYPVSNHMVQGYSMILALFGLVLLVSGPRMIRLMWFPIAYLALAVKISDRIWELIAWNLQKIAAQAATVVMNLVGLVIDMQAQVRGSTIELISNGVPVEGALNVAEACSGLRMLMAFIALSVAVAFLARRPWWQRIVILLAAVPVAVAVNVGRVTTLGILYAKVDPELASGDFHKFIGILMLLPALGILLLLLWIMDQLFIDDAQAGAAPAAKPKTKPTPGGSAGWAFHPGKVLRGALVGGGLAGLCGLVYTAFLAWNRPDLFEWFTRPAAAAAIGLGIVGAAALLVIAHWLTRDEARPGFGPNPTALGMAAGVLLVSLAGFNSVVSATNVVFIKEPVDLRIPLFKIPKQLGPWQQQGNDEVVSAEQLEALGTEQYVTRQYIHTGHDRVGPGSIVRLHVAYYTGTPDTVPHVPDRCYTAGGAEGLAKQIAPVQLSGSKYSLIDGRWMALRSNPFAERVHIPATEIDTTVFTYGSPGGPGRRGAVSNAIYFFAANGRFFPGPDRLRAYLAVDITSRYSYYCKIEVNVPFVEDADEARRVAGQFLSLAMPEIMACLPDWAELTAAPDPDEPDKTQAP